MDGYLLIDKPVDWTSFDVVAKVRSILRQARVSNSNLYLPNSKHKIGHSGTLDPMASGLLILLSGAATKQQDAFMKLDKVYEAEITLGAISTTDDAEGSISRQRLVDRQPDQKQIEAVLSKFKGEIEQVPPDYSAVHVGGQRAYKLARSGKRLALKARTVQIYDIIQTKYRYPKLKIEARVSSGTYIRALARDVGQALGCGAYLSQLRRTSIGQFSIATAIKVGNMNLDVLRKNLIMISNV